MIPPLALATAVALALMTGTFLLARRIGNFSLVDIAWSLNFTPIALAYALSAQGTAARRTLMFVLVAGWSLRLSAHLARRIVALHPREEGRYVELRRLWAADLDRKFFSFFMFQAVLNVGLSLPFWFVASNPTPFPSPLEIAGALVFLVSLIGEATADAQLDAFKRDPASAGKVCQTGLWRYSRHPNYFFEWLVWCAYALMASDAPLGWVSWACPALMLYFLLRVTGIPATEAQALRSRGEAYREYQSTTSRFVPWLPRSSARRSSP